MLVLSRDEKEWLLALTLSPGWKVLREMASSIVADNQNRLVKSNFTELGSVRFLQGEISGIQRLFDTIDRRIADLEGDR